MINNDAILREYYIKLQNMYNDAVTMLTAMNESLTGASSEIEVNLSTSNNKDTKIRIPSFIYLENKLNELDSTIHNVLNIPNDGEAWISNKDNSYKLNIIRSDVSPISPIINNNKQNITTSITSNNILKDLVSPKTFIKLDLSNLPNTADKMLMKKITIKDKNIFEGVNKAAGDTGKISYSDCNALLYNCIKGQDYEEYESVLNMPIKMNYYNGEFNIIDVSAPYFDNDARCYTVKLDTLMYYDDEDNSNFYYLKVNDKLCLGNQTTVYKIKSIEDRVLTIEEIVGHANLDITKNNSEMKFKLFKASYNEFKYIDVPLEENQYIVIFLSTIHNNVRSIWGEGLVIDLSTVKMVDKVGLPILDINGNQYNYLSYYNEYCTNLGDIILGLSKSAYPQITNYTTLELEKLLYSEEINNCVNQSLENVLQVVPINKHLTDDLSVEDIKDLHTQKNEINSKLQTCQSNIDQVYSTMLSTDFSQNVSVTQQTLQDKIKGYYSERTLLQKQLNAVIDNINSKSDTIAAKENRIKYRVRGITNASIIDEFLKDFNNVNIIGLDVEYKYASTTKDTTTITDINNSTFTDWNKQYNNDKERHLEFNTNGGYTIYFDDYKDNVNVIKWNQLDIPIKEGEDVIIRIRYKYSVGQPFITLYTPWSELKTVMFPKEFTENIEVDSIIETNTKDTIPAAFNKTLIDEGYSEHIQDKILSNQQTFLHIPENIYSGFNTPENNLISLKDKLLQMSNDIENYKQYVEGISNTSFEVYLNYDDNSILLSPNSLNKINIYNTDHITDMFIKKEMNIIVKNTGSNRLNLYSIFPGNTDEHLITSSNESYLDNKSNYERVPMFINNVLEGQYLGQWIYFRQNNPYSKKDIYYNEIKQNGVDYGTVISTNNYKQNDKILNFKSTFLDYIATDNCQPLLGFRNNQYISGFNYTTIKQKDANKTDAEYIEYIYKEISNYSDKYNNILSNFNTFIYNNYITDIKELGELKGELNTANQYVLKYEDIIVNKENAFTNIDTKTSLSDIVKYISITTNSNKSQLGETEQLVGAFLYPNLLSKAQVITSGGNNSIKYLDVGASLSIPIVFEYYVESSKPIITKSLYFDIRNSLISEPTHYMIEVTGNFDYTTTGEVYKNVDEIVS